MSQKTYALVAGWIFAIAAAGHALRLLYSWNIAIGGWTVPLWFSGVGVVVAIYLSYQGFRLSKVSR